MDETSINEDILQVWGEVSKAQDCVVGGLVTKGLYWIVELLEHKALRSAVSFLHTPCKRTHVARCMSVVCLYLHAVCLYKGP